jgi:hypothetical protein
MILGILILVGLIAVAVVVPLVINLKNPVTTTTSE